MRYVSQYPDRLNTTPHTSGDQRSQKRPAQVSSVSPRTVNHADLGNVTLSAQEHALAERVVQAFAVGVAVAIPEHMFSWGDSVHQPLQVPPVDQQGCRSKFVRYRN